MSKKEKELTSGLLVVLTVIIFCCAIKLQGSQGVIVLRIGVYSGSYWDTPNGDCYQILDHAIRRFQNEHPHVKIEYINGIGTDSYSEWLAEQILKGKEPDLYFVLPEDFNLLASSGALAKLDHLMKNDKDFHSSMYYEPCLKAGEFDGGQYALPHESVPTIMFVNKTLLRENNIDMPDKNWTWEDFYQICDKITDVEKHRFGVYDYTWVNALYSNGTELFSQNGRSCQLTDERVQEAIRFIRRLNALNEEYSVTSKDFDLGNVAFRPFLYSEYRTYQPYPWRVKKYTSFEWDGICMPAGPEGDNVSELHTMLLGLSSRTKHQQEAWEFAKLLSLDEELQKKLYSYSRGISPLRSVAENEDIINMLRKDIPGGNGFDRATIHKIMSKSVIIPHFTGYDQAMSMAENAVLQQINSRQSDDVNMLSIQREINRFLTKQ